VDDEVMLLKRKFGVFFGVTDLHAA